MQEIKHETADTSDFSGGKALARRSQRNQKVYDYINKLRFYHEGEVSEIDLSVNANLIPFFNTCNMVPSWVVVENNITIPPFRAKGILVSVSSPEIDNVITTQAERMFELIKEPVEAELEDYTLEPIIPHDVATEGISLYSKKAKTFRKQIEETKKKYGISE